MAKGKRSEARGTEDASPAQGDPSPSQSAAIDNRRARRAAAAAAAAAAQQLQADDARRAAAPGADGESRPALAGYDQLSEELWLNVLFNLDGRSACAAACACSGLARIATHAELWARLDNTLFGCAPRDRHDHRHGPVPRRARAQK